VKLARAETSPLVSDMSDVRIMKIDGTLPTSQSMANYGLFLRDLLGFGLKAIITHGTILRHTILTVTKTSKSLLSLLQ
jgi:hypothetical protein